MTLRNFSRVTIAQFIELQYVNKIDSVPSKSFILRSCFIKGLTKDQFMRHKQKEWKTRPDTQQPSRGQLGGSSNAKNAGNSKNVTDGPMDQPTR